MTLNIAKSGHVLGGRILSLACRHEEDAFLGECLTLTAFDGQHRCVASTRWRSLIFMQSDDVADCDGNIVDRGFLNIANLDE